MKTSILLSLILAIAASPAWARTSYQGSFERTLTVSGTADLEVFTHSGDVTLRAGGAGEIHIVGKIHVEDRWLAGGRKEDVSQLESNPPIHQDGSHVRIDYVPMHEISIDYEITLPADSTVRAESGSGNLTVEGLQNGFEGHTGSGDVRLDRITGTTHVHSGSGNITGHSISGPVDMNASSGDIRLEEMAAGDVKAHTGSGNVEVRGIDGGAHAETGSGNIELEGKVTGSWYVKTGSGNAELRVPSDAAFDLDASTGSGNITVDHPVTTTVQGRVQSPQKSITGKVRGGGSEVTVHTGSGDIHIQ